MLSAVELGLTDDLATEVQNRLQRKTLRPAAVLIALLNREEEPTVLLTRRTRDLPHHPGQISFPGGKRQDTDPDHRCTALRETWEEVGLKESQVTVLGYLPDYPTMTGFCITPVIGWVEDVPVLTANPQEVETILEISLRQALDLTQYHRGIHEREGLMLPHFILKAEGFEVWGATAGMLHHFAQRMQ